MVCWQSIVEGGGEDPESIIEEVDYDEGEECYSCELAKCADLWRNQHRHPGESQSLRTILLVIVADDL